MPDGDVYDRNIDRWWQTAARRVFESDGNELAPPALLRALGRMMKDGGCPGFDVIVAITADAICSEDVSAVRREASTRLECVRRSARNDRTTVAVEAARRLLAAPDVLELADPSRRPNVVRQEIAERFLIDLAEKKYSAGVLLRELVEIRGVSIDDYRRRAERARSLLASSPELSRLASQVLTCPTGAGIKEPRPKTPKPSQEVLVHMALSG